jgi:hypothetical protein
MFALLNRTPRTRKSLTRQTANLFLERLEDRLSPVSISPGPTSPPPPMESLSLNVTYLQNKQVTLSGNLTGASGAIPNETINLSGAVSGTAVTNAQGAYSVTLTATTLGQVSAASADGMSNIADFTLVGGTPTITNFGAMAEDNGLWYFFGTVANAPPQGEVVNFGGINALQGQSVAVSSSGSFEFYAIVNSGNGGWATAEAVDWWGDTSQIASDFVNC